MCRRIVYFEYRKRENRYFVTAENDPDTGLPPDKQTCMINYQSCWRRPSDGYIFKYKWLVNHNGLVIGYHKTTAEAKAIAYKFLKEYFKDDKDSTSS